MLKLFVFPIDRNVRLCKFFIVTILFFISVLLACPFSHAFDGPGLYKDGEKVIGFDLAPSDEADIALNATKTMAEEVDKKRRVLPENMADADSFSEQKSYIKTLLECKELVTTIKEKLEQGKNTDEESDLLVKKGKDLVQANLEIIRKFNEIERECQERGYSQTILDRHGQMVKEHKEGVSELLRFLKDLDDQSDEKGFSEKIEKLYKFFSDKKFKEDPPLVNAQALPVNIMKMEAPVVQAVEQEASVDIRWLDPTFEKEGLPAEVKSEKTPVTQKDVQIKGPGDIDILAAPPTQDDLDPTIDVQFTEDITNLANSLNNSPLKMYEYVKDNFEFEPYLGSRKGSQETLNHRSGNDYDLSSLLIALFRVSNIPARYVTGIVEMTPDRAKNWLGVENAATAGSILTTAGMEGVVVDYGDGNVAIQCRRVWVEAYIPYTNYRGIGNDDTGKMWVSMDPVFKQYDYQAGIDIPEEMGFDAEAFINDYISTFHEDSPVELYKQQIIDYLAVNYPDLTYEDILRTRSLRDEVLGIIPGSLPYKLLSHDGEYSEIASDKRYQIRFHIHGSGSTLDYTANLPEIAGKQVTISYIGATAADQQVIDDAGGIYGVSQPWLVNLKPVLKVDGCDVAIGSGQVTMGIKQDSDMYFTPPIGAQNVVPAIYNEIIAGTYQGIGIDTWNVVTNFFAPMSTSCEESYTGYLLHDTAMKYLGRVDVSNNEVGKTMQIVVMNDVAEAIVEHVVDVSYDLGGNPLTFEWSGLIVDADRSITGSFSVTGDDESCEFMRLTGADGSNLENRIFEDGFDEPAVSTIKILELASDMGIPIYKFEGTPCSTIYSSLNQPSHVEDAICSAVADGHVVTIPRDPITYYDWTGTGWIDMQANCAAGYIISGGRSGGATVKEWDLDISPYYCVSAKINSMSPSSSNNVYCAGDTSTLKFNVTLKYYDKECAHKHTDTKDYPTPSQDQITIKEIADAKGPGEYTFVIGSVGGCGECGVDSKSFTIVKLEKLQYQSADSWTDVPNPLYVLKGTSVNFKALKNPSSASWPTGKPVWGGTAGASGTSETKSVTFNAFSSSMSDYKTVTAECGDTTTANVIVYELTGELTPQDNFTGRSTSQYGIAEVVDLSFTATPSVTAAQAGGLRWKKTSGVGTLTVPGNDGTGIYDAGATTGNVTLKLEVQAGPSQSDGPSYNRSIVAPSGASMVQAPSTGIWHVLNTASVGFRGHIYLEHRDVSFRNIQFREGTCTATASGFYAYQNGIVHSIGSWVNVSSGNSTTGCQVLGIDTVQSAPKGPPYSAGDFLWPIPWQYRVGTGGPLSFTTANHHKTADAAGKCCIEKAGAGPFCKNAADPKSGY